MLYINLLLLAIFIVVAALLYGAGLWSNTLNLVNVLTAGLVATNYFEPLSRWLDKQEPRLTFTYDFLALWLIFAVSFSVFRAITDYVSKVKVKFFKPVEVAGSALMAIWVSWALLCFATMTLHTAPLSRNFLLGGFQERPESKMMYRLAPDRKWLAWVHRESQGSLSRLNDTVAFDPRGDFILRYGNRRERFAQQLTFLAPKGASPVDELMGK
ncbi:MAG: CvpA family protein [Pirellulales bacterium]